MLAVETRNASGLPVTFTDPVTLRVQFFDGSLNAANDLVDFEGSPAPEGILNMRLVRDVIDGPEVDFQFIEDAGHILGTVPGGGWAERSGITTLTGPSGRGVWGAVADPAIPVELSVFAQD